jgi:hypothetical protein
VKLIFIFIILFLSVSCSKPKTVLICGDHVCINKQEAEQYFEENLSIEVKIINKKKEKKIDLVELNLKEDLEGQRQVEIFAKDNTNKDLKDLSSSDISEIKKNIKEKKKRSKIAKKTNKADKKREKFKIKDKNIKSNKRNVNKSRKDLVDICTIIEKCSIDEISKYLQKRGNKKSFPDITTRQ